MQSAAIVKPVERAGDARKVSVAQVIGDLPAGRSRARVGEVIETPKAMVLLRTTIGGERIVDMPTGEDLPRIC